MEERKQLGTLLVEKEIISARTLERALERQRGSGRKLGEVLEEMGVITADELVDALAKQFGYKTVRGFADYPFPENILQSVGADLALQKHVFPLKIHEGMLAMAVADPFDLEALDFIAKKAGMRIMPVVASRLEILAAITRHYLQGKTEALDRRKILVVDDSKYVVSVIVAALTAEGYDVIEAADGIDGLKLAMSDHPDLIICDSIMPRMDGYAMMRAIRANPATAQIPALLLTSKGTPEDEQRAFEAGFLDFLQKPVLPARVVSRVKHAFTLLAAMKK